MTVEKLKRRRGGEKCGATRGGFDTCSSWMQVPATKLTVWFAHIYAFLFVAFFLSFIAFSSFLFYFMNPFFIFHVNQWTFIYSFNYFCVFFSEHRLLWDALYLVAEVLSIVVRSKDGEFWFLNRVHQFKDFPSSHQITKFKLIHIIYF